MDMKCTTRPAEPAAGESLTPLETEDETRESAICAETDQIATEAETDTEDDAPDPAAMDYQLGFTSGSL